MDFFEQQDRARRNTVRLVVLLALAVLSLIAVTTAALTLLLFYFNGQGVPAGADLLQTLDWSLLSGVALAVITVVVLGSFYKSLQLASGGAAVAEALGGRLINSDTRDADERRILNVVEEMAIASGTPVPPVYLLEDDAINAFAAGYSPQDAVIGITRGCIRLLSRSELQGVVAHEFSHIFHGDMRLNLRLVALLHGILVIGLIGHWLLRSVRYRRVGGSRRDNSAAAVLGVGAALMVIGYAGTFFGSLIKAAVSRQREFLADAAAVQFTRDPGGIGGALKKIGGYHGGTRLAAANAAEFSHLFFGEGVRSSLGSLLATHPPLPERIRRIEPRWDGRFPQARPPAAEVERVAAAQPAAVSGLSAGAGLAAIAAMGQPDAAHLAYARDVLDELDPQLREAAHEPYAARALVYGLLLHPDPAVRGEQLRLLEQHALADVFRTFKALETRLSGLDRRHRLPLLELAIPALKQLSPTQHPPFRHCLQLLIGASGRTSLWEWALYRIVVHNLEPRRGGAGQLRLQELPAEVSLLLSLLAHAGHGDADEARAAFAAAAEGLPLQGLALGPREVPSLTALNAAVERLGRLRLFDKPVLLKAMVRGIEHDGRIMPAEAELFRALADALDCPMPPLLPT